MLLIIMIIIKIFLLKIFLVRNRRFAILINILGKLIILPKFKNIINSKK